MTSGTQPEQSYIYPSPGSGSVRPHAVSTALGHSYAYDPDGQLHQRQGDGTLTLDWTALHTIAAATSSPADRSAATSETYVYDTAGKRILRRAATESLLSLDGAELTLRDGNVTARRYYSSGGATIAARDAHGLTWLFGDYQGSSALTVDATGQIVNRQRFQPYGSGQTQPQDQVQHGFLNRPHDALTGLDILDLRGYDSTLGSFAAPDPVNDPYDVANSDPYSYAADSPTTLTDPSGACIVCDIGNFLGDLGSGAGDAISGTVHAITHPLETERAMEQQYEDAGGGWMGRLTIFNDFNPVAPLVNAIGSTVMGDNNGHATHDLASGATSTALFFLPIKLPRFRLPGRVPDALADLPKTREPEPAAPRTEEPAPAPKPPTPQDIVQNAANTVIARGKAAVTEHLSLRETRRYNANPARGSRFLGQAFHRAVAIELRDQYPGRFAYRTRGPDFLDTTSGKTVELTTPEQVGIHQERPGYGDTTYATYRLGDLQ
ncbi:MAG: RHS repeat-associated core domain-containing protein [Mycobacteriales bacterium]